MKATILQKWMVLSLRIVAGILVVCILVSVFLPVPGDAAGVSSASKVVETVSTLKRSGNTNPDHKRDNKKLIALTFDDGPTPDVTNRILDSLEKYNARATFFVVGRQLEYDGKVVNRAVKAGCEIGNHTWEHKQFYKYSTKQMKTTLQKTRKIVKGKTGADVILVRPTYGQVNGKTRKKVKYPMIYWNVDTEDWRNRNASKILNKVKGKVKDGDIILMHDLYGATADAVKKIIPYLQKQGFELVTVSELMKAKGIKLQGGKVYYSAR